MENYYNKKEVKKYCVKTENHNYDLHHFDTPIRSLVVAPSGSGKSSTLFCKGKGTYDNIYIFCKCKDEPLYRYLSDKSKGLIEVFENLGSRVCRVGTLNEAARKNTVDEL